MQTRRPSAVPPLAIVLPHPPLPRRRSSLLSATASPRTPRSCGSPTCSNSLFFSNSNRKSTDSWNSSNLDEQEYEWKPEQTLLLSRTLEALPAHLVTPFIGPVPPSNLLDKIARGVAQAKGPIDWPHSIRATRVKLLELARIHAKEAAANERRKVITEEDDFPEDMLQHTMNTPRKPLYRQSSMDFMNSAKVNIKDNDNLNRLSNRLQRTDRIIPNPTYHPYSRPSHPRSPSPNAGPLIPSTPKHRSSYSASSSPAEPITPQTPCYDSYAPADPRIHRIRRSDPFCTPAAKSRPSGRKALKRAPSFGASSGTEATAPSSDEEEKLRSKQAKKARTKTPNATSPPSTTKTKSKTKSSTSSKSSSSKSESSSSSARSGSTNPTSVSSGTTTKKSPRVRANLQRNPSIFGAELPHPQIPPPSPQMRLPPTSPPRTLRRMRVTSFARAPARRISFGSLVAPVEEPGDFDSFAETLAAERESVGLGSAFQLQ